MMWYFFIKKLQKCIYKLKKKKKKNWTVLIQVKPTIAILNHSKPAIIFQSKDKELDIDHEEEEEDENDYSVRNNRTIQLFSTWRGGWISLRLSAKPRGRGVVVVVAAMTGFYG